MWKDSDWSQESTSLWRRKDGCIVEEESIFCWTARLNNVYCTTKSGKKKEFDSARDAKRAADSFFEKSLKKEGASERKRAPYVKGSKICKGDVFEGPDFRIIVRMRTSVVTSFRKPGGVIDSIPNDKVDAYLRDYERILD